MVLEASPAQFPPIQPRFVWRRILAYLVDLFLVSILGTILVAAIQPLTPLKLIAPSALNAIYCTDVTESQRSLPAVEAMKIRPGEKLVVSRCIISNLGLISYNKINVTATNTTGYPTISRSVFYPVNENNEYIKIYDTSPFILILMPLFFAIFTYQFGRTIGKKIMGLRLVNVRGSDVTLKRLSQREYLRQFPIVISGIKSLAELFWAKFPANPQELVKSLETMQHSSGLILFGVAVTVLMLLPYLLGAVLWRGRLFYDNLTGFEVGRS